MTKHKETERDKMPFIQIIPEFYAILKDCGCSTFRRKDGTYIEEEAQNLWEAFQAGIKYALEKVAR